MSEASVEAAHDGQQSAWTRYKQTADIFGIRWRRHWSVKQIVTHSSLLMLWWVAFALLWSVASQAGGLSVATANALTRLVWVLMGLHVTFALHLDSAILVFLDLATRLEYGGDGDGPGSEDED